MAIEVTTDLNLVNTAQIVDGSVTSAKIADNAVVAAKIAAGAVGSAALASGAVVAASIAAASVGTAAISSGAATSGQILQANGSGAVTFATPATGAVTLISSSTVTTATQTFTLSSIPQGYQSLRLVIRDLYSSTTNAAGMNIYVNGVTTGTYGWQYVRGLSATASAARGTNTGYLFTTNTNFLPASTSLAGTFATLDFYNYSNTTKAKHGSGVVFHQDSPNNSMTNATLVGFVANQTDAITSLVFEGASVTDLIAVGSRFDLYGVS
jgi:hypothetical protein